jgi:hypothetical protein
MLQQKSGGRGAGPAPIQEFRSMANATLRYQEFRSMANATLRYQEFEFRSSSSGVQEYG